MTEEITYKHTYHVHEFEEVAEKLNEITGTGKYCPDLVEYLFNIGNLLTIKVGDKIEGVVYGEYTFNDESVFEYFTKAKRDLKLKVIALTETLMSQKTIEEVVEYIKVGTIGHPRVIIDEDTVMNIPQVNLGRKYTN